MVLLYYLSFGWLIKFAKAKGIFLGTLDFSWVFWQPMEFKLTIDYIKWARKCV